MTVVEQLAEFVANTHVSDVHSATLDQLRLHIFDTVAAAIVGWTTDDGKAIAAVAQDIAEPWEIQGSGLPPRAAAPLSALATCVAIRCTEVDDIYIESCTTPGSVVVTTALALANRRPVTPESFLSAVLVGYELLTRLGNAVDGATILYQGIWPTYLCAPFAAAGTAARLLELPPAETAHALATALTLTSGTAGRITGPSTRWLTLGCAVQNGIVSTMGSRQGLRGDLSLLDGRWSQNAGIALDREKLIGNLGGSFEIDKVSIKPYCSAKQATSALQGFISILDSQGLQPSQIDRVTVSVPGPYRQMIDKPAPIADRLSSITSVQYQLALAAFHREGLRDVPRRTLHNQPEFRAFMDKVSVATDDRLASLYPKAYPARVEVQASSGSASREVHQAKGDPGDPLSWDEEIQKLVDIANGIVDEAFAHRLAGICRGLGTGSSVEELLDALGEATGS